MLNLKCNNAPRQLPLFVIFKMKFPFKLMGYFIRNIYLCYMNIFS